MEILIFASGVVLGVLIAMVLMRKKQASLPQDNTEKLIELNKQIARLEGENENYKSLLSKEEEMQKKLTLEFENIAAKILKQNTSDFSKTNQEEIENLLKPFKEKIEGFEKKIADTRTEEIKDITSLKTEIKNLMEKSQEISEEANNLTKALKGENKTQGNWGEVILQRTLEMSGLRENIEYVAQESVRLEGERNAKNPDIIVHLPEDKHLIIDSKVSLVSYEKYYNSEDNEQREKSVKEFIDSVKTHIKGLSEKTYQNAEGLNSPDFVLMFIPIEASFNLIFQTDKDLFEFAWDKKIMVVGPSTLLASLKTINLFWNQEKQTKNVMQIVKEAGSLYDKFVGLLEDLKGVSGQFNKTKDTFDSIFNKLSEGNGNLINRVKKLELLGAKAQKQIPQDFLSDDVEVEVEVF